MFSSLPWTANLTMPWRMDAVSKSWRKVSLVLSPSTSKIAVSWKCGCEVCSMTIHSGGVISTKRASLG